MKAECPFFIAHMDRNIVCEAPIPGCSVWLKFKKLKDKEIQYEVFCCKKYENCEMYTATEKKYEEE